MVGTAIEIARRRQAQAEANRRTFTFATQMVDELRAAGFESARVVFCEEDGRTAGKRGEEGVTATWWPGINKRKAA